MAGDDISVRIKLTGEKDFRTALDKLNAEIKENSSALKLADTQLQKSGKSMEGMAQKSAALEKAIVSQQNKIAVLGEQIASSTEKYGAASSYVLKLKDTQNKANIELTNLNAAWEDHQQALNGAVNSIDYLQDVQATLNAELAEAQDTVQNYNKRLSEAVAEYGENSKQANILRESIARVNGVVDDLTGEINENNNALRGAERATAEAGKAVGSLEGEYKSAERGALSFADAVKASAIGNIIADGVRTAISALREFAVAGAESAKDLEVSEMKLAQVMGNTLNATDDQIEAIKNLIEQQEQYGVVSKNAQTAATQELATYVTKQKSIEKLLPVMNDMIAQQHGVNASSQSAITIATALGKTLDGQVGSLQDWGYRFSDAEKRILQGNNELRKLDVISRVVTDSVGGMSQALRETSEEGRLFGEMLKITPLQQEFGKSIDSMKNRLLIALIPALTKTVESINNFAQKNGAAFNNLARIVTTVANILAWLIKVVSSVPPELIIVIGVVVLATKAFVALSPAILAISGTALPAAGTALATFAATASGAIPTILSLAAGALALSAVILSVGYSIRSIIVAFTGLIAALAKVPPETAPLVAILGILFGMLLALSPTIITLAATALPMAGTALATFAAQANSAIPIIMALTAAAIALAAVIASIGYVIGNVKGMDLNFDEIGNKISQIKAKVTGASRGYAKGTSSAQRGLAWVGERGPELVRFRGGEQVYTAAQSIQIARSGQGGSFAPGAGSSGPTYGDYYDMKQVHIGQISELKDLLDEHANGRRRRRARGGM